MNTNIQGDFQIFISVPLMFLSLIKIFVYKSSHLKAFSKTSVPKNFAKFFWKHLYWSVFQKETSTQMFSCEFLEHLPRRTPAVSVYSKITIHNCWFPDLIYWQWKKTAAKKPVEAIYSLESHSFKWKPFRVVEGHSKRFSLIAS